MLNNNENKSITEYVIRGVEQKPVESPSFLKTLGFEIKEDDCRKAAGGCNCTLCRQAREDIALVKGEVTLEARKE